MFLAYYLSMKDFKKGDNVAWRWANGTGKGTVEDVRTERTEIKSKNEHIVRNGTSKNPAVIIKDSDEVPVLKLASELESSTQ